MRIVVTFVLKVYQAVGRSVLPPCCRFYPSCSDYALSAVKEFGTSRGLWLTARRLLRCHPFHPGGWDPLPRP